MRCGVHFFRYTFTPIFTSSCPGTETFPSVEAIVIDFPDFDCTGALPSLPETQNG